MAARSSASAGSGSRDGSPSRAGSDSVITLGSTVTSEALLHFPFSKSSANTKAGEQMSTKIGDEIHSSTSGFVNAVSSGGDESSKSTTDGASKSSLTPSGNVLGSEGDDKVCDSVFPELDSCSEALKHASACISRDKEKSAKYIKLAKQQMSNGGSKTCDQEYFSRQYNRFHKSLKLKDDAAFPDFPLFDKDRKPDIIAVKSDAIKRKAKVDLLTSRARPSEPQLGCEFRSTISICIF